MGRSGRKEEKNGRKGKEEMKEWKKEKSGRKAKKESGGKKRRMVERGKKKGRSKRKKSGRRKEKEERVEERREMVGERGRKKGRREGGRESMEEQNISISWALNLPRGPNSHLFYCFLPPKGYKSVPAPSHCLLSPPCVLLFGRAVQRAGLLTDVWIFLSSGQAGLNYSLTFTAVTCFR